MTSVLTIESLIPSSDHGVTIAGQFYPYTNRSLWGLVERARWNRDYKRLLELEGAEDPTEEEGAEYDVLIRDLTRRVLPGFDADTPDVDLLGTLVSGFLLMDQRMRQERFVLNTGGLLTGESSSPASTRNGRKPTGKRG